MKILADKPYEMIGDIHVNHEEEYKKWAQENEPLLQQWHDENEYSGILETSVRFAFYCSQKFLEWKFGRI